jgi:hypothetical protein
MCHATHIPQTDQEGFGRQWQQSHHKLKFSLAVSEIWQRILDQEIRAALQHLSRWSYGVCVCVFSSFHSANINDERRRRRRKEKVKEKFSDHQNV